MSHRLTRKEIKRDEFREAIGRTVDYASSHRRLIAQVAAAIIILAILAGGVLLYLQHRGSQAAEALNQALKVYHATIDADSPRPDDPREPTFADEAARRARAKELFEAVSDGFGSSDAGGVARVYLAQIAAEEGDLARARELWQGFLDRWDDAMLSAEVQLNLLKLDLAEGKTEEVAGELEGMLASAEKPMPEDVILFELAAVREQLGRTDEALSAYQRIVDEFPGSPYSREAQQKAQALAAEPATS